MFGFGKKKEPEEPDKYCDRCGCELLTLPIYTQGGKSSGNIVRLQQLPWIDYDTKTGIGTAPRGEFKVCPKIPEFLKKSVSFGGHYAIRVRELEDEVFTEGCK